MKTAETINLLAIAQQMKERPPSPDPTTAAAVHHYELCRSLLEAHPMQLSPIANDLEALQKELEQNLLASGKVAGEQERSLEIPCLPAAALNDPNLSEFLKDPCPVIFKGAAKDSEAVKQWTPTFFGERYGDFPCWLVEDGDWDVKGTISDATDDILAEKEVSRYIHNLTNLFNEHPDLEAQLELDRFAPLAGSRRHLGTHFFLGGAKTGVPYHCANNLNIFFNIYGEKDWYFVHPKHSFWMYGMVHKTGSYGDSPIDHQKSAAEQREKFPLFEQVPVYSARLCPGDVLLNPPWWWHAITNVSSSIIACATRWMSTGIVESNPTYSVAQRFMPYSKHVMKVLRNPKARITDELYREQFEPILTNTER